VLNKAMRIESFDRRSRRAERCAERLVTPDENRIVHLLEDSQLAAARFTLLQVAGKVSSVALTCFPVKICDQVFRSMTRWSFVNVCHFNYL
jgi:hypothetical protein